MQDDVKNILKKIKYSIVEEKNFEKARQLLTNVFETYRDDSEICCWAWFLLYHAENTEEKINCLIKGLVVCKNARTHYPNDANLKGISSKFKNFLKKEIETSIENNEQNKVRHLLKSLVEIDENSENAWISLENIAELDEERINYLKKIIDSNPNNHSAQDRLDTLLEKNNFQDNQQDSQKINVENTADSTNDLDSTIEKQQKNKSLSNEESTQIQENSENQENVDHQKSVESVTEDISNTSQETTAKPVEKKQIKWYGFFKTGKDIVDHFDEHLAALIQILQTFAPDFQEDIKILNSVKEHYKSWDDRKSMNIFLSPAVRAGTNIAHTFLESNRFEDAFWTANLFVEMSKALVSKNPQKKQEYKNHYKNLLVSACCATGCSYWSDHENIDEIRQLYNHINKVCLKKALETFFHVSSSHVSSSQFRQTRDDNQVLKDEILNNSSAWLFDKHLQNLLQNKRSSVSTFIEKNLPQLYPLKFSGRWQDSQKKWTELLKKEGFEEVLQTLKKSNSLINHNEVGKITPEQFNQILEASKNDDYKRINELLKDNAEQLVSFLHYEVNEKFDYREPWSPFLDFKDKLNRDFRNRVPKLAYANNQKDLQEAEKITKKILKRDLEREHENQQAVFAYQDWLAYIQLKMGKGDAAEQQLNKTQKRRRDQVKNFITHWNLAVLAYHRKKNKKAYNLLSPLLEINIADTNLVKVLLMLSHELGDFAAFSELVSLTVNRQFFPLAFIMAYEQGDEKQQRKFLGKIIEERSSNFQLPPVDTQFNGLAAFRKTVDDAMVEVPLQLIEWLEARIKLKPFYIPNYVELAHVFEKNGDIDHAFPMLCERFNKSKNNRNPKVEYINDACRDLLEFCKRNRRSDLGQKAYDLIENSGGCVDVLKSFDTFSSNKIEKSPSESLDPPKSEENSGIGSAVKKWFSWGRSATKETVGMFIDHENLLRSLENISRNRGKYVPTRDDAKAEWLYEILQDLSKEFVKRTGDVTHHKIAVAFWNRPSEVALGTAYEKNGFTLQQPKEIKQSNAVDFKLVDEVRRLQLQADQDNSKLKEVVIVSGDTDYAHMVSRLIDEGINVQIWGGNEAINQATYSEIVGKDNIVIIDDICGL